MLIIEIIIGSLLAIAVLSAFRFLDEERYKKFFAGSLMIASLIYIGFATFGLSVETATYNWLIIELIGLFIYTFFAYAGVKLSAWFLAIGWLAHILWDVILHSDLVGFGEVAFVPGFYPAVCIGFDVVFGVYIAYRFYFRD